MFIKKKKMMYIIIAIMVSMIFMVFFSVISANSKKETQKNNCRIESENFKEYLDEYNTEMETIQIFDSDKYSNITNNSKEIIEKGLDGTCNTSTYIAEIKIAKQELEQFKNEQIQKNIDYIEDFKKNKIDVNINKFDDYYKELIENKFSYIKEVQEKHQYLSTIELSRKLEQIIETAITSYDKNKNIKDKESNISNKLAQITKIIENNENITKINDADKVIAELDKAANLLAEIENDESYTNNENGIKDKFNSEVENKRHSILFFKDKINSSFFNSLISIEEAEEILISTNEDFRAYAMNNNYTFGKYTEPTQLLQSYGIDSYLYGFVCTDKNGNKGDRFFFSIDDAKCYCLLPSEKVVEYDSNGNIVKTINKQ